MTQRFSSSFPTAFNRHSTRRPGSLQPQFLQRLFQGLQVGAARAPARVGAVRATSGATLCGIVLSRCVFFAPFVGDRIGQFGVLTFPFFWWLRGGFSLGR